MSATYSLERWPLGWVFCSTDKPVIPMDALSECLPILPRDAVMDGGIVHYLRQNGVSRAVMCIVTKEQGEIWRAEITKAIQQLPPQERWWKGLDVGTSSAAIFAMFADSPWSLRASEFGGKSTPSDAADFGRCKRLLDLFPEWRAQLDKVGEAYPTTNWPKIVARWAEIEAAPPKIQNEILRNL